MPLGSFESLPFRHGCAATLSPFHGDSFWLVLPPACPERGFEPSAPSGRCSEGRIGRNREYCKRQRCKTTIFQPAFVAASATSRRRGCIGAALVCVNPSVNPPCGVLPAPRPGRWVGCDTICQDIRVNAQVGTRSPYSLPFVILPVPARSPFRLLVHRTRSTPNLKEGAFSKVKKTTLRLSFLSLYSSLPLGAITTRRLGSSPSLYVVT